MGDRFAFASETTGPVRHDTGTLGGADLATEIGLAGSAQLALAAFRCAIPTISMFWIQMRNYGV